MPSSPSSRARDEPDLEGVQTAAIQSQTKTGLAEAGPFVKMAMFTSHSHHLGATNNCSCGMKLNDSFL